MVVEIKKEHNRNNMEMVLHQQSQKFDVTGLMKYVFDLRNYLWNETFLNTDFDNREKN